MRPASPPPRLEVPAHPRFAGFAAFAARELLPWLAAKEADRRRALRGAAFGAGIVAAFVAALQVFAFAVLGTEPLFNLVAFGAVPALMGGFAAQWPLRRFRADIKDHLLERICAQLGLRHTGDAPGLPFARFAEARLLPAHDDFALSDGIETMEGATAGGGAFTAAEAKLTERSSDSDGDRTRTAWRGLLVAVPAPRPFTGRTIVIPERGRIERFFDSRAAERIELGMPDLERGIEIRTTDPAEARAALTATVMRSFADLARNLAPARAALALVEGDVLLAIETEVNRFEGGSVFQPLDGAGLLGRLLADFALLLQLAEALGGAVRGMPGARGSPPHGAAAALAAD